MCIRDRQLCNIFNGINDIHAYIPKIEEHVRYQEEYVVKPLFPNYLFIETNKGQNEFDIFLESIRKEKKGIIRELKKDSVSALRDEEKELLNMLLNNEYVLKMSEGYIGDNGKAIITKGPLKAFEDNIVNLDKRNRLAYLDIKFLDRNIKAGLWIKKNRCVYETVVRVAGYSAFFNVLSNATQDDIIERTEQTL